jgi:dTDP-4-dehydrorhamnose 3,5-epimerase
MIFTETTIPGAFLVDVERHEDERGFFARTWCAAEFAARGLASSLTQCSISYNARRGTLRGMHYQAAPYEETKLVRCTRGAIYDVIVDLATRRWEGFELTAENRRALYIPRGLAHGFLTLEDATEVSYQIDVPYEPGAARGVRWDDPALAIEWPFAPVVVSERDRAYGDVR